MMREESLHACKTHAVRIAYSVPKPVVCDSTGLDESERQVQTMNDIQHCEGRR